VAVIECPSGAADAQSSGASTTAATFAKRYATYRRFRKMRIKVSSHRTRALGTR
jgi:hypothetical protein